MDLADQPRPWVPRSRASFCTRLQRLIIIILLLLSTRDEGEIRIGSWDRSEFLFSDPRRLNRRVKGEPKSSPTASRGRSNTVIMATTVLFGSRDRSMIYCQTGKLIISLRESTCISPIISRGRRKEGAGKRFDGEIVRGSGCEEHKSQWPPRRILSVEVEMILPFHRTPSRFGNIPREPFLCLAWSDLLHSMNRGLPEQPADLLTI